MPLPSLQSPGGRPSPPGLHRFSQSLRHPLVRFLFTLLVAFISVRTHAEQFGDFTYSSDGSAITLIGYTGPGGAVIIPENIEGLPVKTLGVAAFQGHPGLTSVTLPESVTTLEGYTFSFCKNLESVNIPEGVTYVGTATFLDCVNLKHITIPDSVTYIASETFSGCTTLAGVDMSRRVTNIGSSAFFNCRSLKKITIPSGTNYIGIAAFSGCSSLLEIEIPASAFSIQEGSFANCTSLLSIQVSASNPTLRSINGVLFNKSATALIQYPGGKTGDYAIPDSVTTLGDQAFYNCVGLTNVSFGANPLTVYGRGFSGCSRLLNIQVAAGNTQYRSVDGVLFNKAQTRIIQFPGGRKGAYAIPGGVTFISNSAFWSCADLTGVTIPESVVAIENYAFHGCTGLASITLPSSVSSLGDYAFSGCVRLTDMTLGSGLTFIGTYAFWACKSLVSVTFPARLDSIDYYAFQDCTSLARATFEGHAPANFDDSAFPNPSPGFTIYYWDGRSGFTSPMWKGYPSAVLPVMPTLEQWRQQYFGDGAANSGEAADEADPDADGLINGQEYAAGTSPVDPASDFRTAAAPLNGTTYTLTFTAQPGRHYVLQRLIPDVSTMTWQSVATLEPLATTSPASLTDTTAPALSGIYRIKVNVPTSRARLGAN